MQSSSRHPLAREITLALILKLFLLLCGYFAFFGPATRLEVTPTRLLDHLAAASAPARAELPVQAPR